MPSRSENDKGCILFGKEVLVIDRFSEIDKQIFNLGNDFWIVSYDGEPKWGVREKFLIRIDGNEELFKSENQELVYVYSGDDYE